MRDYFRSRSYSLSMVVLVMLLVSLLQGSISYTTTFGALEHFIPFLEKGRILATAWLLTRLAVILVIVGLWLLGRKVPLFKAIIVGNLVLTVGLLANMFSLVDTLLHFSTAALDTLLVDVLLMAVTNILIFSIWYWIIDPPGVNDSPRDNEPWDFLFPQRGTQLPHYESWQPRYTDYIFLAFTTSFAFSPTDTLPLTRRAKMLMLLQSTISIVTLTGIAGTAINILASGS